MATLDDMIAPARVLRVADREYKITPITLGILCKMQLWVEELPLARAREEVEKFGDMYDDKRKRQIIDAARAEMMEIRKARDGTLQDEARAAEIGRWMQRQFSSPDGVVELLGHLLMRYNPDMARDEIAELLEVGGVEDIQSQVDRMNSGTADPIMALRAEKKTAQTTPAATGRMSFGAWLRTMASRLMMWLGSL